MNRTFIIKMMQAKKLQYEAIKEIMPEKMQDRIDNLEKEAFELIKDISLEMMKNHEEDKNDESNIKKTKKVKVNFN